MAENQRDRWAQFAACKDMSPEEADRIFFDNKPGRRSLNPEWLEWCGTCPVCKNCFEWAIVHNVEGVWGNATKRQRTHPFLREYKENLVKQAEAEGWLEKYPVFYGSLSPIEDQEALLQVELQFQLDFEIEVQKYTLEGS